MYFVEFVPLQFFDPIETVDKKDLRYSSLKHFCFGDDVKKDLSVTVRELGGAIAPLWPSYIKGSTGSNQNFIFVIDAADPGRVAEAGNLPTCKLSNIIFPLLLYFKSNVVVF